MINKIRLMPKVYLPAICSLANRRNMQTTQSNRLNTPKACIFLIRITRFLKFFICPSITSCGSSLYFACNVRIRVARVRNRFVNARSSSDMAGNRRAGVVRFISILIKKIPPACVRLSGRD